MPKIRDMISEERAPYASFFIVGVDPQRGQLEVQVGLHVMCDVTPRVCVTLRWWSKEGASVTRTIGSSLLAVARDTSA